MTRASGPFLERPEKFSHPESHSKISKLMITELFYSRIINTNSSSLHKRNFRRIHFSVFRYRWTKNGFTGPKSFRGFRETGCRAWNWESTSPWGHHASKMKTNASLIQLMTMRSLPLMFCFTQVHTSDDHDDEREDTKLLLDFCDVQRQLIQTHNSILKLYKEEQGSGEELWKGKSKELVRSLISWVKVTVDSEFWSETPDSDILTNRLELSMAMLFKARLS